MKRGQAAVEVGLDDIQSAANAGQNRLLVQFHADDPPMPALAQPRQQSAGAAAEVQNARRPAESGRESFRNPTDDAGRCSAWERSADSSRRASGATGILPVLRVFGRPM